MRYKNTLLAVAVLTVVLALGFAVGQCFAATPNLASLYAGANGVWFTNGDPYKADVEGCATAKASLSPHLSAVGSVNYGFGETYIRSTAGVRATATDVDNPDFSVGLGIAYHMASRAELRPNEWAPDVSVGFRPWPEKYPRVILTAQAWYGLQTNRGAADVGVRYQFRL